MKYFWKFIKTFLTSLMIFVVVFGVALFALVMLREHIPSRRFNKAVDAVIEISMEAELPKQQESKSYIHSPEDIELTNVDGDGEDYTFTYRGEEYSCTYIPDNWKIRNSYKITNEADIKMICEALIEEHPVHGKDLESYRTADDMAYEWVQHNLAFKYLPEGNAYKTKARDVDLNPADQGLSIKEMYERRTGQTLTMDVIMNYITGKD